MKSLPTSILLLTLLACTQAWGQDFGSVGHEWYYSGHNAAPPAYSGYIRFSHAGDTVLAGRPANLLLQQNYAYTGAAGDSDLHIVAQASDTVFLYREDLAAFVVLYVFNGSTGDTMVLDTPFDVSWVSAAPVYRVIIDSVSVENYGGVNLKKYHTRPLDHFYWPGDLVDQIGCTGWFFPIPIPSIPEGPGEIRCFSNPQVSVNFNTYACDYRLNSAVFDARDNIRIEVFPNPTNDRLHIMSGEALVSVRVVDLSGSIILETNQDVIDIDALSQGLYLVQVKTSSGKIHVQKISKM
jgi:hypothetical protein